MEKKQRKDLSLFLTHTHINAHTPKFCHGYWLENAKHKWILYLLDLVVVQKTQEVT